MIALPSILNMIVFQTQSRWKQVVKTGISQSRKLERKRPVLQFFRGFKRFVDELRIEVSGGQGGNGCIAFQSLGSYKKKPNGGCGGSGGDVYIRGSSNGKDLALNKYLWQAASGGNGSGSNKAGKKAKDLIIDVPLGTLVYTIDRNGKLLKDFDSHGEEFLVARGGEGGAGNEILVDTRAKVDVNVEGKKGEKHRLLLSLKSIADVGLVGWPNVGKSSLLGAISRSKPKVANYKFTTVHPSIGTIKFEREADELVEQQVIKVADIPGISDTDSYKNIGNTSLAKSVARDHKFLQHIERTKVHLYVLAFPETFEITEIKEGAKEFVLDSLRKQYFSLIEELEAYQDGLSKRPAILAVNKLDHLLDAGLDILEEELFNCLAVNNHQQLPSSINKISVTSGEGVPELMTNLLKLFHSQNIKLQRV
eukprot:snap_masked-scaffold_5-processed-gene-3.16-mRNA-1 protein AED:0.42 eAED:0.43 QI:0/0/0/0.66/1/1/3/0/421